MSTMLVSLNGSARDQETVRLAATLAHARGSSIELLQPRGPSLTADTALSQSAAAQSLALRVAQIDERVEVVQRTYTGRPADQIVARARESHDTLVVLPTGKIGRCHHLSESVVSEVIRRARVPVVALPQRGFVPSHALRRLLVPLDESLLSESALPLAIELARQSGAEIRLLWVENVGQLMRRYGNTVDPITEPGTIVGDIALLIANTARVYLQHTAAHLEEQGIRAGWSIVTGSPSIEINRQAWVDRVDLILMATHGRSRLARLALGSVTLQVLRDAVVPVLVLPPNPRTSTQRTEQPTAMSVA